MTSQVVLVTLGLASPREPTVDQKTDQSSDVCDRENREFCLQVQIAAQLDRGSLTRALHRDRWFYIAFLVHDRVPSIGGVAANLRRLNDNLDDGWTCQSPGSCEADRGSDSANVPAAPDAC
jgi:hypothetical protein